MALILLALLAAEPALIPPKPLGPTSVEYPTGAPAHTEPVEVRVIIRVNEQGDVVRVTLTQSAGSPFDEAVMNAAPHFSFTPGKFDGQNVPVDINFSQVFTPPPVVTATTGPTLDAVLSGRLEEKGTRLPVSYATIRVRVGERSFAGVSDEKGEFEVPIVHGPAQVAVTAIGYKSFVQRELLVANEKIEVGYLVERTNYNPYAIVVVGKAKREEIARTVLRDREIQQVPGTFGDPFRVVQTMPGVTQMMSLLPFPIVRGSNPGNTGFLIDGVRVPLLFHLLAGPSVIHPEFVDEIEFFPGSFSVEHGRYTAGIVNGLTRRAGPDEKRIDIDLSLLQAGALVRWPIKSLGVSGTIAGRIGYPGLLLSLASPDVDLSYWDYQARVDGGTKRRGWSVFAFGAQDAFTTQSDDPDEDPSVLRFQFHRVDVRYDRDDDKYQVTLGFDESLTGGASLQSLLVTPRATWVRELSTQVDMRAGFDGLVRQNEIVLEDMEEGFAEFLSDEADATDELYAGSWLMEVLWRPFEDVLIRPGARADFYDNGDTQHVGIDPRLLMRWDVSETVSLKGGAGVYHQTPRFVVPIPGLDQLAFREGLIESLQTTVGTEIAFGSGFSVDVQTYFAFTDPVVFDLRVNLDQEDLILNIDAAEPPSVDEELQSNAGRSFGAEILLRRRSTDGPYGWIAYTLSRSERRRDGEWVAFDFDRTHIFHAVAGIPLPRNWSLGLRVQVQGGRPVTTTQGEGTARTDPFVRFDFRVDKRAVWNDWLLDFYVDVSNVVLASEEIEPGNQIRYVLPTIGFRAVL